MHALETRRVRGVVFDLWNTLAYDPHQPNPIVALADAFALRGDPGWPRILERAIMRRRIPGIDEAITVLSEVTHRLPDPAQAQALRANWKRAGERARWFPDVEEALRRLSGRFRLGLLSNTQSFGLEFMDRLLPAFDARLFSYELGALKPGRAIFSRMARMLRLAPGEVLMVGDNLRDDVLGAEKAGWQAVLIRRRTAPLSFHELDRGRAPLASLLELVDLLADARA
jgi:HAD superfamily hydrolase (TIGR01549 family)